MMRICTATIHFYFADVDVWRELGRDVQSLPKYALQQFTINI